MVGYVLEVEKNIKNILNKLPPNAKVLDVGCGTQIYKPLFENHQYTGIDVEIDQLDGDAAKPDLYFDGVDIPFPDNTFDLLVCIEVLEHAENYKQLINNMSRVLRPGGILLVSTPFMWAEHGLPYDFRRLTETSLRKQTSAFGLKVIHFEKSLSGIEAIRTIVKSEMTIFKRRHINHKKPLKRLLKVLDIPMNLLWKFVQWYWSLFYRFERIYIRNILIAEKM